MFAVPVIANLPAEQSIQLLVWSNVEDGAAFSYSDTLVNKLDPEASKATIGGVEHYVFKYAISAEMMTDTICARPVIVAEKKGEQVALEYGNLVDYSVVEYVHTAKGGFAGIPALTDSNVLGLLDAMLDFGALAQIYLGGSEPYGAFLANDELKKIWVTPIIGGSEREPVFAGFFKYEEGGEIDVFPPHFDGLSAIEVYDSTGKVVDNFDGRVVSLAHVNGDISFKVKYDTHVIRQVNIEGLGKGITVNSLDAGAYAGDVAKFTSVTNVSLGTGITANLSSATTEAADLKYLYHGFRTVPDPENPENLYIQWTATTYSQFGFSGLNPSKDLVGTGFGDTVYPSLTFEMTIGRVNGQMIDTDWFMLRHRLDGTTAKVDSTTGPSAFAGIQIFKFTKDGEILVSNGNDEMGMIRSEVIGQVPETGFIRVAIAVDSRAEKLHSYVEDENGEMKYVMTTDVGLMRANRWALYKAKHQSNITDDDASNDNAMIAYESLESWFKNATLETGIFGANNWKPEYNDAIVEINGSMVPVRNADGTYNTAALQKKAEETCSVLLDDYRLVVGDVYGSNYD